MNSESTCACACGTPDHFSRRTLLKAGGLMWLTPVADLLAVEAEKEAKSNQAGAPARSVIVLWLQGGPSQVDTFDPHPGSGIAPGVEAIETAAREIQLASGFEQTAEVMSDLSIIRSVISKEGDHARAFYNMKTGYRPNPALVHPSIGSIVAHELDSSDLDLPTHVSILPGNFPGRGGYLGSQYDAFQMGDPSKPVPDVHTPVSRDRQEERLESLAVVEKAFARGRIAKLDEDQTLQSHTLERSRRLMSSEQLAAFDISEEPAARRSAYGNTPFGRGCLAAVRLVEAGVRCVEVTLNGWDSHLNNREVQAGRVKILDPALAAITRDLKERGLFERTVVLCGGEFGRTPKRNGLDGRDHWPHGFSIAIGGGGIAGGRLLGATDPAGEKKEPEHPVDVADIHATIQHSLGIDYKDELMTPVGRPIALSEGKVIEELL